MRYIFLISFLLTTSLTALGQTPTWHWAKQGGSSSADEALATLYDPLSKTVYFTGYFDGTALFSPSTINSNGGDDLFLARYTADGQLIWTKKAGSTGDDVSKGICTDGQGNIYITGSFENTATFYGTPNINLVSSGKEDIFVAKYDSLGNAIWAVKFGNTGADVGNAIAYENNYLYITGQFEDAVNFGTSTLTASGDEDVFVLKILASNGGTGGLSWARKGGGTKTDVGQGITADANGVYVTGYYDDEDITFDNFGSPTLINTNHEDVFFVSYTLNGTSRWASKAEGSGHNFGYGIVSDGSNLYATGSFEDACTWSWSGAGTLVANAQGDEDIFLCKIDRNTGQALWLVDEGGGRHDKGHAVAIDGGGNPLITGTFENTVNFGGTTTYTAVNQDILVAKYDPLGNFLWVQKAGGSNDDVGTGIAASGADCYVSGFFHSSANFSSNNLVSYGSIDAFGARLACNAVSGVAGTNNPVICAFNSTSITLTNSFGNIQWQSSPAGLNTWSNIIGANGPNHPSSPSSSTDYRAVLSNMPCNSDTSNVVSITVLPPANAACLNSYLLAPGSLIIPMDNTLQVGGGTIFNLKAYGLVNELLRNHIPVKWIIEPTKAHDGVDAILDAQRIFPAPFSPGAPGPIATFTLRGGPFAIDSAYVSRAIPVISAYANNVTVLRTTLLDTLSLKYELTFTPYIAVLENGGNQAIHIATLNLAGFNSASSVTVSASGVVIDSNTCYTFASEPHWGGTNAAETAEIVNFINGGGNFLAQCEGIQAYENTEFIHTDLGIITDNQTTANSYYNNGEAYAQFEGVLNADPGGSVRAFDLVPGSSFRPDTYTIMDKPISGVKVATQRKITPLGSPGGYTFYLGGHDYTSPTNDITFNNGVRMYCNAALVPAARPTVCDFNFACDLQINKSQLSAQPTTIGDTVQFLVEVCALGPGTAYDISILDTLHPNLTYISHTSSNGAYTPATGQWNIASLEIGFCDSLWISCSVDTFGLAINEAILTSLHPLNGLANDSDTTHTLLPFPCTANAGLDTVICGTTTNLAAISPNFATGIWHVLTGGATLADSLLNTTAASGLTYGSNTFEWEVNNAFCTEYDTVTIYAIQLAAADAGIDGSTCDSSFVLAALPPPTGAGVWTSLQPGVTISDSSLANTAISLQDTGAFLLIWTVTDSICSSTDTVVIKSFAPPYVFAGNDTIVCENQALLNATFTSGSNGLWTALSGGSTIVNSNAFSTQVNNLNSGINLFEWNQSTGICQGIDTVMVSYLPADIANAGPDFSFCGMNATMAAVLPNGHTGTFVDTSGTVIFGNTALPNSSITLPDSGAYPIWWIIDNGNCQDTATVNLQSDLPIIANAGLDQSICEDTLTLNGSISPLGIGSGTWSQAPTGVAIFTDPNAGNTFVAQIGAGASEFYWTATNGTCTSADSVIITRPTPVAQAGPDFDLCEFDTAILAANDPSPFTGTWQIISGPIGIDSLDNENATVTATDVGSMTLAWEIDHLGCLTRDTLNIDVFEQPIANAGPDQTLNSEATINLQGNALPLPFVTQWTTNSNGNILNPISATTEVTNLEAGEFSFFWTVTSGPCAPSVDTVIITINELVIPNAISPNQDGKNETFLIKGLEDLGTVSLEIFNRWGGIVFETTDYKNDWAGSNMNGSVLPDDTYYYVLKASGGFEQAGFIIVKTER